MFTRKRLIYGVLILAALALGFFLFPRGGDSLEEVAGPDKNRDGIRDDIEAYIDNNFQDPKHNAALRQTARAMQQTINEPDKEPLRQAQKVSAGQRCLDERLGIERGSEVGDKLEQMHADTSPRIRRYLRFNKNLSGLVLSEGSQHLSCDGK